MKNINVILITLAVIAIGTVGFLMRNNMSEQGPKESVMEAGWIRYEGKNFSFSHPTEWIDQTNISDPGPTAKEYVFYKIPKFNGFGVELSSGSYEEIKSKKTEAIQTTVGGRPAIRLQTDGPNNAMPEGDSVIIYFIKANNGDTFTIDMNITRSEVPDEIINKVISSFNFKD